MLTALNKIKKKELLFYLIYSVVFILIALTPASGDIQNHIKWGRVGANYGLKSLYKDPWMLAGKNIAPNYPPLILICFALIVHFSNLIYQILLFLDKTIPFFPTFLPLFIKKNNYLLPFLIKMPALLGNLLLFYFSYRLILKFITQNKQRTLMFLLLALNPIFLYNSAKWGQIDVIPLAFVIASFYFIFSEKNLLFSTVSFTLSLLFKQTSIIFLPVFLIIWLKTLKKQNYKYLIKIILTNLLLFYTSFIPFIPLKFNTFIYLPLSIYIYKILFVSGLPFTSNHAFNFWYILTGNRKVLATAKFAPLNLSFTIIGEAIATMFLIPLLYKLFTQKKYSKYSCISLQSLFLTAILVFFFFTKIHERHSILAIPFLFLSIAICKQYKKYLIALYFYFSSFTFLNMYDRFWQPYWKPLVDAFQSSPISIFLSIFTGILIFISYLLFIIY